MHIPDGWVDLPTSAVAAGLAGAAVAVSARRAATALADRATTLPAVLAAYLLVAELLVLPLGVGTSAHLVGTGLAALLVGPAVAILCVAAVVVVQALLLADGGVTALGLNLLNNGVVPALATWVLFAAGWAALGRRSRRIPLVAGVAAGLGALTAAAAATVEFAVGGTDVVPVTTVATVFGTAHLAIAVVEGALTAAVVAAVLRLRPDLLRAARRGPRATATARSSGAPPAPADALNAGGPPHNGGGAGEMAS